MRSDFAYALNPWIMAPTALVTGGARRIGRAITLGLAREGYDVLIQYHQSEDAAHQVVREVEMLGQRAIAVQGDLADARAVDIVAEALKDRFGTLDLLVNNASLFEPRQLLQVEEEEWDRVMAVNLKAPFLLLKATAPLLKAAQGSVINLVDLSAMQPWAEYAHHAVSKAGLLHLTRIMARAMAPQVRVNAIAPGTVLPPEEWNEAQRTKARDSALLQTLGSPDDVVRTVLFLTRSPFITGEVVVVDGGRMLGQPGTRGPGQ
jgi:pteridine reductase